jgi:hypothetical protein
VKLLCLAKQAESYAVMSCRWGAPTAGRYSLLSFFERLDKLRFNEV